MFGLWCKDDKMTLSLGAIAESKAALLAKATSGFDFRLK